MWSLLIFVLSSTLLVTVLGEDEIAGKGKWLVLNVLECEDPEQYDLLVNMSRRKINRTHDCFSVEIDLDREIDLTYGVEIIADKEVDGGFKFFHRMTDGSFCNLVEKYTGENWPRILSMANIDPPACPIPAGKFKFEDFVIDYRELQETGLYGTFDVRGYMLYNGRRIICVRWLVRFEKERECDDEDDADD